MEPVLLQIMLGIFAILAFAVVGGMLKKYELEQGPWIMLSLMTLCLVLSRYMTMQGNDLADKFFTGAFVLLALIAVVKFWDIMQLTQ